MTEGLSQSAHWYIPHPASKPKNQELRNFLAVAVGLHLLLAQWSGHVSLSLVYRSHCVVTESKCFSCLALGL